MTRTRLKKRLKIFIAAHHYAYISKDIDKIAKAVRLTPKLIKKWMKTSEWRLSLKFWGIYEYGYKDGDFSFARRTWEALIKFDEHANPSEYPDSYVVSTEVRFDHHNEVPKINALEMYQHKPNALIVEPFCVDNLHADQIHDRIAEEREFGYTPCRYDGQLLAGYHWWLYPNDNDGIFSKVFARSNMFGNLLCGAGEKTHLVCIEDGRLVLSAVVSDNAVLASDKRLLICL